MVERGLEALSRALDVLLPQDGSAIADSAFLQVDSRPNLTHLPEILSVSTPYSFQASHLLGPVHS